MAARILLQFLLVIGLDSILIHGASFHRSETLDRQRRSEMNLSDEMLNPDNLQNILSRAVQDDGVVNPSLLLREMMQDPMPIPNFNISHSGSFTDLEGQFEDMKLRGLRGLTIRKIHVNLAQMNVSATLNAPALRMEGIYNLDGTITFFSINGGGNFWMNVSDLTAVGGASLQRTQEGNGIEVKDVNMDVQVGNIKLHFEDLFGGGSWSSISNTLLNQLSELIFDQVRASMLGDLKETVKKEINSRLAELPDDLLSSNSICVFDDILGQASEHLEVMGFDPYELPEYEETFSRRVYFLNVHGQVRVYEGLLYGLSTIHRTGDVILVYENNTLTAEATLGFKNLTGNFNWNAHFMGIGPISRMKVSLAKTSAYIRIQQDLKTGSRPRILDLALKEIGQIWLDVDGMGSLDFLFEIIVNLMTNALKHSLAKAILGPVRESVQLQLNALPVEFL